MPINRITSTEFANIISSGVSVRDPSLDVSIGAFRDIFVDPQAEVLDDAIFAKLEEEATNLELAARSGA